MKCEHAVSRYVANAPPENGIVMPIKEEIDDTIDQGFSDCDDVGRRNHCYGWRPSGCIVEEERSSI